MVSENSKPNHFYSPLLITFHFTSIEMEMENWELSKGQKLQPIKEHLDAGLPCGSALLTEPLDFGTQEYLLYF